MTRKRKWGLAAVMLIVALGIAAWTWQQALGQALYKRAVDQRVGQDMTSDLPDGLHLLLCGTGSPFPDADRAGPCAAIIAGRQIIIVDAGEGATRTMAAATLPVGRVSRLMVTHVHSDHIDGIGPLMLLRWTQGTATTPLPVHGPVGIAAVVDGFNAVYATDHGYRVAHHGSTIVPPSGAGAVAMPFATPPADGTPVEIWRNGGLVVTAFRVDHGPVEPAVGYRFDYRGRSIVISGDSSQSANIVRNARGADILLHDALQPALLGHLSGALARTGQGNAAQITRDIVNYHATPADAARTAQLAGAGHLVLTHIVPVLPSRLFHGAFLGDAADHYTGQITIGADRMLFSLPADGSAQSQRMLP